MMSRDRTDPSGVELNAPFGSPGRSAATGSEGKSGPVLSTGKFASVPGDWIGYILLLVPLADV